ncbi:MAG: 3-oxoadipyl-CoA thiolase [Gammaproteobacteria bacterium]|nr:3-oxoadipyl-CoA thiolase [Gammaproteobacteria bacterium]
MDAVYICDAVRTPIGRYGGALASVRADELAAVPLRALVDRHATLDWAQLDEVFMGCANQAGEDNRNVARMSLLLAGLPESVPGVTLNRLCGSGMDAVGTAARAIASGQIELAMAGGVESMSRAPLVMAKAEAAFARDQRIEDTTLGWRFINGRFRERFGVDTMAETAENVAAEYQISRQDQDAFALRSQQRASRAQASGYFAAEIAPVSVVRRAGGAPTAVDSDEYIRADANAEELERLRPVVRAAGTVTAGNASGINDGASALLLASAAAVRRHRLVPQARVLGMATAGVPPRVMGVGPVPATRRLCARLALQVSDFDAIELNEAFAAQAIACLRELGLPDGAAHVNCNGGAIALGHPLGMSGARLVMTLAHQLQESGGKLGLATMCVGVGQGIALALERA